MMALSTLPALPATEQDAISAEIDFDALPSGYSFTLSATPVETPKQKGEDPEADAQASAQQKVFIWLSIEEWERVSAPHPAPCACPVCPHIERQRANVAHWQERATTATDPRMKAFSRQQIALARATLKAWYQAARADALLSIVFQAAPAAVFGGAA